MKRFISIALLIFVLVTSNVFALDAVYNNETGAITVSCDDAKYIIAGFNNNGELIEVKIGNQGEDIFLNYKATIAYAEIYPFNFDNESVFDNPVIISVNPSDKVQILPDAVIRYMTTDFEVAADTLLKTRPLLTKQNDVKIEWEQVAFDGIYTFTLYENDIKVAYGETYFTDVTLNNLMIGTKYKWHVVYSDGTEFSGDFETQDIPPRFITTDSVDNVRDMGGWKTESGKKIKQGLLYRGATLSDDRDESLDADGNPAYDANGNRKSNNNYLLNKENLLSDNDRRVLRGLGIITEIDLRSSGEKNGRTTSPLGDTVAYYDIAINADSKELTNPDRMGQIFKLMADKANYPIYFHCTGGNDRTGRIAYLVNGLLGVSKEDLIRDWELSTFSWSMRFRNDGSYWDGFNQFMMLVDGYEGETLSEKIENLMINTYGLTKDEIESIKNIMLEK